MEAVINHSCTRATSSYDQWGLLHLLVCSVLAEL